MTAPDPRRDEIAARLAAATPGPWTVDRQKHDIGEYGPWEYIYIPQITNLEWTPDGADCHMCGADFEEDDAEFIANAPADIPYLLAALADRDAKLARVEALAQKWQAHFPYKASELRAAVADTTGGEDK